MMLVKITLDDGNT